MKPLEVKLLRLAKEDLRDTYLWYETQEAGLGSAFLHEAKIALQRAADQPSLFPVVDQEFGVRRVLLKRFPYKAFFTVESNRIVVHVILDARRSTDTWKKRLV